MQMLVQLVMVFVLLLTATADGVAHELSHKEKRDAAIARINKVYNNNPQAQKLERVDLTPLASYKLASLYAGYLGLKEGPVVAPPKNPKEKLKPPFTYVSFAERLKFLYTIKFLYKNCKTEDECVYVKEEVFESFPSLFGEYLQTNKRRMGLQEFVGVADRRIKKARQFLDWGGVCSYYDLGKRRCKLLQTLVETLTGQDMVAYGMTEILPAPDGNLNVTYLDLLLHNAGAEFVYRIPAIADVKLSLGYYQFTPFSIRRDGERTEGVSIINQFVKRGGAKLADIVTDVKGDDQHVAAFYFAVYNIAKLLQFLSDDGLAVLEKVHTERKDELVMYIAGAHHQPVTARVPTVAWVNAGAHGRFSPVLKRTAVYEYVIKTRENKKALAVFCGKKC